MQPCAVFFTRDSILDLSALREHGNIMYGYFFLLLLFSLVINMILS